MPMLDVVMKMRRRCTAQGSSVRCSQVGSLFSVPRALLILIRLAVVYHRLAIAAAVLSAASDCLYLIRSLLSFIVPSAIEVLLIYY